jgi:hypothetical protein
MGFKYVFIPADSSEPMQELEYATNVDTLETDTFRGFAEKYFAGLGQSVDRSVLLQQLQERTGKNLEEMTQKGEMKEEALDRLLACTSVEIFPVQLPVKEFNYHGVSVYCDDKGIAKELQENPRVSGIVQACGYPGQTFRGDCFIGRVMDDNEDEWRRIDFTLKDCSTDASWVADVKKQRSNRSSSDMTSLAAKMNMNNPAHLSPAMLEDAQAKGETEQYRWQQAEDEVEVTFKKEGISKADKAGVKVAFGRQKLKVEFKGEVLLDGSLCSTIHPDECTWTLSDGILQVTLSKATESSWPTLLKES